MKEIRCNSCGKKIYTSSEITECIYCSYDDLTLNNINDDDINEKFISHLLLTYNKTGENILIKEGRKVFLGRKNFGKEVLRDEHISKSHCSIEIKGNDIFVEDVGSFNGTFYKKTDEEHRVSDKQKLEDNELLFLGKESFLIGFVYEDIIKNAIKENNLEGQTSPANEKCFICPNCGREYIKKPEYCRSCQTKL